MAENKLKTALREVVSAEFAEIPGNEREINHSFSDEYCQEGFSNETVNTLRTMRIHRDFRAKMA